MSGEPSPLTFSKYLTARGTMKQLDSVMNRNPPKTAPTRVCTILETVTRYPIARFCHGVLQRKVGWTTFKMGDYFNVKLVRRHRQWKSSSKKGHFVRSKASGGTDIQVLTRHQELHNTKRILSSPELLR